MQTIIIIIHLFAALFLIALVLIQPSEGGGFGAGGSSGFMTTRSSADILTRMTAILVSIFFGTSILLGNLARYSEQSVDILKRIPAETQKNAPETDNGIPPAPLNQPSSPPQSSSTIPAEPPVSPSAPTQPSPEDKVPNSQ